MKNNILARLTQKLIISVLVVIYASFALVQATYAWINITNENTLDGSLFSVVDGSLLSTSVDGINFYDSLPNDVLMQAIGTDNHISDCTSRDGRNIYASMSETYLASANKSYISFSLWFRTQDPTSQHLFLIDNVSNEYEYEYLENYSVDGTYVISKGVEWKSDITFSNGEEDILEGSVNTFYASEAIRIGIAEEDLDESFEVESKEELRSKIFDLSGNEERGYGATFGAIDYYNKTMDRKITAPEIKPTTIYSLSTFLNPYQAENDDSLVSTFQPVQINDETWYYTKITVNIWMEGWDADCYQSVLDDKLLIQLKFRGSSFSLE